MSDLIHAQHDDYDKLDLLLCYGYDIHIKGKQVPDANASHSFFVFCFSLQRTFFFRWIGFHR